MTNLIDGGIQHSNLFLHMPLFDEIYYAGSAYQYLHKMSPDVWVHPQLGIYFIVLGIILFGMSTLGWRIMPDITSILLLPVIYIFAKQIFKTRKIAIIASILMFVEFMHFTIGRIAGIDSFVTLFLSLEYYFLYKYFVSRMEGIKFKDTIRNLIFAATFFALSCSCKWIAIYSVLVIVILLFYF